MEENYDTRYLSREYLKKFIHIYRRHPALWKVKSREYTDKASKQNAYSALVSYSRTFYPNANKDFVTKKIQSMRNSFRKELRRVTKAREEDRKYKPTLWYYDLLKFTKDQEDSTDVTISEGKTDGESLADNDVQDDLDADMTDTPLSPEYTEPGESDESSSKEFEALAMLIAVKLKKMTPSQRLIAELLINKILFKGLFNELTRSTTITDD